MAFEIERSDVLDFGWTIRVLSFDESGPRVLHTANAGAYDGETTHEVEVRGATVVHVQTRGGSRSEEVLVYDARSRALRRRGR